LISTPAAELQAQSPSARRIFARADAVSIAVGVVLAGGAFLRIKAYAANRSLWLDESFLALNLIRRGWGAMLGQLDFNQGSAPGFLLFEKGAATVGTSELTLRLLPLLLGLATLVLIAPVAARVCSRAAVPVACGLTAFAPSLIYYSSELKQYSGDVTAFVLLVWVGLKVWDGVSSRRHAALAAATGAVAIVISQPAVFVAAGIGAVLLAADLVQRRRLSRATVAIVGVWAGAACAVLVHALHSSAGVLRSYGGSASLGGAGGGGETTSIMHSISVLPTSVAGDLGLPTTGLEIKLITYVVGAIGIAGLLSLLRHRPWPTLLVATPILVTIGASVFGHYPISGRTVLFVVPAAALFVAEGIILCAKTLPWRLGLVLGVLLVILALEGGVRADARTAMHPTHREEVRSVLRSVAKLKQPGDRLFVTYPAQYALAYYGACRCAGATPWRLTAAPGGSSQWAPALRSGSGVEIQPYLGRNEDLYLKALRRLPPGRTWVLLSHVADARETAFLYGRLLSELDKRGPRLASVRAPGALAVLYDLR
jgi:hypothetical protein